MSSPTPSSPSDPPAAAPDGTIRSGKLAGRSLTAAIWILAAPVLVQQTLQACVGMADKVLAGRLPGEIRVEALDAIGIGSFVGWFISIAMAGLGIGGQAIIARAMGGGDIRLGHRALGQTLSLSVGWGVIVGVILWMSADAVAAMCRLTPEATVHYRAYIRTLSVSIPLAGIMMSGAMCLHGAGETTKPAVIAVVVNVTNIVFSWLLSGVDLDWGEGPGRVVLENPFDIDLDVIGIAAGTAVGWFVGALLTVMVLARGVKDLRLEASDLPVDRSMMRRIVRIGIPNFCEGISMWLVNIIVLRFIGEIAMSTGIEGLQGAHVIAIQWEAFSFMPGFAIGTAAAALAGQYLGAGNPAMARKAIVVCTLIAIGVMSMLGAIFVLFGPQLTMVVSSEPVHLEHVPRLLMICGIVQVFFAVMMVVRQGLRGVGDTRWTFTITTFSSYALRLPATWFFGIHLGLGLEGIWFGLCGEFIFRAAFFTARFLHGGWTRLEV